MNMERKWKMHVEGLSSDACVHPPFCPLFVQIRTLDLWPLPQVCSLSFGSAPELRPMEMYRTKG